MRLRLIKEPPLNDPEYIFDLTVFAQSEHRVEHCS